MTRSLSKLIYLKNLPKNRKTPKPNKNTYHRNQHNPSQIPAATAEPEISCHLSDKHL